MGVKATGPGEDSSSPEPETKRWLHEPRLTEAYLPKAGNHRRILCPARDKGVSPISTQSNEPVSQDGVWSVKVMSSAGTRITPAPFPGRGRVLASVAVAAPQPSNAKLPWSRHHRHGPPGATLGQSLGVLRDDSVWTLLLCSNPSSSCRARAPLSNPARVREPNSTLFPSAGQSVALLTVTWNESWVTKHCACAGRGCGTPADGRLTLRPNKLKTQLFTLFSRKTK